MSRQILAIDIRNDTIAAVLINTGLKSNIVIDSAQMPIAPPSDEDDGLTSSLVALLEKMNPTAANIVVSLPADKAIFRTLSIPFKEDNKIRQVLPFELEQTLPVSVDTLKLDFQKTAIGDHSHVLAVAIDQNELDGYMKQMADANIRPQLVVVGGFPLLAQIMAQERPDGAKILFLDVEIEKTTLFAVRSGCVEMVRSLPSSVKDETTSETLALRVRQTLTAWSDSTQDDDLPSTVYISGPGLQNSDHIDRLVQALEMPVETIDLRQWTNRFEIQDTVQWQPNTLNEAVALAILEAEGNPCPNFHRISSPLRNYWSTYRSYILGPAILFAAVLIIGAMGVLFENYQLKKQVDQLDAQMTDLFKSTFPGVRLTAGPLDQMKSKIKELKSGGSGAEKDAVQTRSIDVLLQISQLIPSDIEVLITRLTIAEAEVNVSGETAGFNSVDDIKGRLEKSELFKQITIASANMDKSGKKVLFKLKIDL